MTEKIAIVSRHPATIAYLQNKFPSAIVFSGNVTAEMLEGTFDRVYGNLTMGIVSKFRKTSFFAVEFDTFPPRGEELSPTELEKFGIRLVEYVILQSSKKAVETALQFAVEEGGYSI